jgi:hypothetical protein
MIWFTFADFLTAVAILAAVVFITIGTRGDGPGPDAHA